MCLTQTKRLYCCTSCQQKFTLILGDTYNDPILRHAYEQQSRFLVATGGARSTPDPGVEVRKIFHRLRSKAIEPFNGLFKNIFKWGGQVPVKGLKRTHLIVVGAVFRNNSYCSAKSNINNRLS